ncbi:hypothetical protein [Pseudomonas fluorescens]|uniref:hypothetical protein n=1 Tax=Pseudomonas fluorescens TaxID=294 RepID=UPI0009B9E2B3|nr:hypothetical protein [Pseudomonas fluorescens]
MEVTVVGSGYVGAAQPTRLAELCRRMCGKDVNASHVADGKNAIAFSGLILAEDINGTQELSYYAVGTDAKGRGL